MKMQAIYKKPANLEINQNVDFRDLSIKMKFLYICRMLMHCLQTAKDLLPNFNQKKAVLQPNLEDLSSDIQQLRLKHFDSLIGYDALMQDHIDQFHRKMEVLWDPSNEKEAVYLFQRSVAGPHGAGLHEIYPFIDEGLIPDITPEERDALQLSYNAEQRNTADCQLFEKLSLKDMKLVHNVFVKCMNYAIQSKNKEIMKASCILYELFHYDYNHNVLHSVYQEHFRNNKDFIKLLQMLRPYINKLNLCINQYNMTKSRHSKSNPYKMPLIIGLLIEHFLNDKPFCRKKLDRIEYQDINSLIFFADDVCRELDKYEGMSVGRDIYILQVAIDLGLISDVLLQQVQKAREENSNFLAEDLRKILLDCDIDFNDLSACVESFAHIIHKSTTCMAVSFYELVRLSYEQNSTLLHDVL